jgi:hypothetical protein
MHEGTPTDRGPSPAARVGYHSGKRLATTIARRIAATSESGRAGEWIMPVFIIAGHDRAILFRNKKYAGWARV